MAAATVESDQVRLLEREARPPEPAAPRPLRRFLAAAAVLALATVLIATHAGPSRSRAELRGVVGSSETPAGELPPPPANGTYLFKLLFVRHGFSCANVPWNACTKDADKLTPEGMGEHVYAKMLDEVDALLKAKEPDSMVGLDREWGFVPRGWKIPGKSKTADGKSDDCLFKVKNTSLVDDQYDDFGNLVALRQIIKDPHITACDQQKAAAGAKVLADWFKKEGIKFDLVGASSLKRAIETVEVMYMQNPYNAAVEKIKAITPLPYLNEKNLGTPFQPENFPYPADVQEKQIKEVFGEMTKIDGGLSVGKTPYPRGDQQWDKFKVVLAMDLLASLLAGVEDMQPNPALVAALEEGRAAGKPKFLVESDWPQVRDEPLKAVTAGPLHYEWQAPIPGKDYKDQKGAGAQEFVIGIGSHSHLLSQYCLEGTHKPNNLAVLEKRMTVKVETVDGKTTFKVAEVDGPCRLIMDAPPSPKPGTLASTDYGENCKVPFDFKPFMDVQPEPKAGKLSSCMAEGSSKHFPLGPDA